MAGRMNGDVAVVTGGGRGIGRAIATAYAREGASVVVTARSTEEIDAVVTDITARGGRALAVRGDITSDEDVVELRARCESEIGPCNVLVNNAGRYGPNRFLDYSLEEFQAIVDVNVIGTVRVIREFLPGMLERGSGRVLNIASTAGKYGSLFQSAYNTSKHGVVGLTRCLALETASAGVRVNAICPGFVETEMIDDALPKFAEIFGMEPEQTEQALLSRVPIGRFLKPEEIADLALFLGSKEGDGVTGQAYTISGGLIQA